MGEVFRAEKQNKKRGVCSRCRSQHAQHPPASCVTVQQAPSGGLASTPPPCVPHKHPTAHHMCTRAGHTAKTLMLIVCVTNTCNTNDCNIFCSNLNIYASSHMRVTTSGVSRQKHRGVTTNTLASQYKSKRKKHNTDKSTHKENKWLSWPQTKTLPQ